MDVDVREERNHGPIAPFDRRLVPPEGNPHRRRRTGARSPAGHGLPVRRRRQGRVFRSALSEESSRAQTACRWRERSTPRAGPPRLPMQRPVCSPPRGPIPGTRSGRTARPSVACLARSLATTTIRPATAPRVRDARRTRDTPPRSANALSLPYRELRPPASTTPRISDRGPIVIRSFPTRANSSEAPRGGPCPPGSARVIRPPPRPTPSERNGKRAPPHRPGKPWPPWRPRCARSPGEIELPKARVCHWNAEPTRRSTTW